jgi:hypothetical protein
LLCGLLFRISNFRLSLARRLVVPANPPFAAICKPAHAEDALAGDDCPLLDFITPLPADENVVELKEYQQ